MVEHQISSIALAVCVFGMSVYEIRRYDNLITPFTVAALPIAFISCLVNFIFIYWDINPVTIRVNFFLLLCFFLIWVVGFLFSYFYPKQRFKNYNNLFKPYERYKNVLIIIALIISIVMFWRVVTLVSANGGWWYLGSQDFEDTIIRGFVAYLVTFGEAVFILLYLVSKGSKNKILSYFTLLILGIAIFMLMVKYNLIWLILMIFFINNLTKDKKIQVRKILKITLILFLVFVLYFLFLTLFWRTFSFANKLVWEYFYKQILNYFLSGTILLDSWLNTPSTKPDWVLLSVFYNFYYVITGNPNRIDVIPFLNNGFETVGQGIYSNVGTGFGVYYLIGGIPFTILMTILFASVSYSIYIKAIKSPNLIILFLMWFILSINTLYYFGQYFTTITFYILPAFFFVLIFIFRLFNKTIFRQNVTQNMADH